MIRRLPQMKVQRGVVGFPFNRALQPALGEVEVAPGRLDQRQVQHRAHVARIVAHHRTEHLDRLSHVAQHGVGAPQFPTHAWVARPLVQLPAELLHPRVEVAAREVGDLQVALGDGHARIEFERARELHHRIRRHSPVVVQDAEVVVRARVTGINSVRERSQDLAIALGREHGSHRQPSRTALRMACSDATSGNIRKKPRRRSPTSCM